MKKLYKTAVFSNGHRDVYKGKRDVKAAWMVIGPKGTIASGHSLDIGCAEKTAASHISQMSPAYYPSPRSLRVVRSAVWWAGIAKEAGKTVAQLIAEGKAENATFAAGCSVEVVSLEQKVEA